MAAPDLVVALKAIMPDELAADLVAAYNEMRRDLATSTLGRSSPGKFVETVVQVLQHIERGSFDKAPDVDAVLRNADNLKIDDGLRICAARIGRAMYSLRSKRNIVHKSAIDPNVYDLRFLFSAAQWVMAELVRQCSGLTMEQAGALVDLVQYPVSVLVEEHDTRRLVLADVTTREEILVLLHCCYPEPMPRKALHGALDRRPANTVTRTIRKLWEGKLLTETASAGCRLTQRGYGEADAVVMRLLREAAT